LSLVKDYICLKVVSSSFFHLNHGSGILKPWVYKILLKCVASF